MKKNHIYEKFKISHFLGLIVAGLINAFGAWLITDVFKKD